MKDWDDNDMEYDFEEDDFDIEEMDEEDLEESNLQFEVDFYSKIAGTTQFQVLNIPDEDGYIPTEKDIKILKAQVKMAGMDLLFRVVIGNQAIVFGPNSHLVGVVPQGNPHGFLC